MSYKPKMDDWKKGGQMERKLFTCISGVSRESESEKDIRWIRNIFHSHLRSGKKVIHSYAQLVCLSGMDRRKKALIYREKRKNRLFLSTWCEYLWISLWIMWISVIFIERKTQRMKFRGNHVRRDEAWFYGKSEKARSAVSNNIGFLIIKKEA